VTAQLVNSKNGTSDQISEEELTAAEQLFWTMLGRGYYAHVLLNHPEHGLIQFSVQQLTGDDQFAWVYYIVGTQNVKAAVIGRKDQLDEELGNAVPQSDWGFASPDDVVIVPQQ